MLLVVVGFRYNSKFCFCFSLKLAFVSSLRYSALMFFCTWGWRRHSNSKFCWFCPFLQAHNGRVRKENQTVIDIEEKGVFLSLSHSLTDTLTHMFSCNVHILCCRHLWVRPLQGHVLVFKPDCVLCVNDTLQKKNHVLIRFFFFLS